MLITPAYAQAASGGNALFELLFPLIMVFAIIYFMILRPQQKRQREHEAMVNAVSRGDTVITQGGLV
ncbi:MAG: preprotein translocase subunit YajC, partial [Parvibaculales bacterium]